MSGVLSVQNKDSEHTAVGTAGRTRLDDASLCYLAPGLAPPTIPDGTPLPCLRKYHTISANLQISNQDVLIVTNLLSDRTQVASIFISNDEGIWERAETIDGAVNLTQFERVRSCCGRLQVISNTRSTDRTTLDGSVTTICVFTIPSIINFQNMGQYAILPKGHCINSQLSKGQTLTSYPIYHPYETKTSGSNIENPPDHIDVTIPGIVAGVTTNLIDYMNPLACNQGVWFRLRCETIAAGSTHQIRVNWAVISTQGTYGTDTDTISFNVDQGTWRYLPPSSTLGLPNGMQDLVITQPAAVTGPVVFDLDLCFVDPCFSNISRLKHITYIQGSTGTKNIVISGTVGYELIPKPNNYSQVTLDMAAGATFIPLEVFTGLLNDPSSNLRLVYEATDFERFVERLMSYDGHDLQKRALQSLGHASLLGTIAGWWKKGIGALKGIGVSPAGLLRRGIDIIERNGYASSRDASIGYASVNTGVTQLFGVGHYSSDPKESIPSDEEELIEDCLAPRMPNPISMGFLKPYHNPNVMLVQSPEQLRLDSTRYLGHASENPYSPDMPDDDDELNEEPAIVEEIKQEAPQALDATTYKVTAEQLIQAWPMQASYNALAYISIPVLQNLHRYATYMVVVDGGKGCDIAIMEWSTQARTSHSYFNLWTVCPEIKMPNYLSYVNIDTGYLPPGMLAGRKSFAYKDTPIELRSMIMILAGFDFRNMASLKYPIFITHHCDKASNLTGNSWSGALYYLVHGIDPSITVEVSTRTTVSRPQEPGHETRFIQLFDSPVGDIPLKVSGFHEVLQALDSGQGYEDRPTLTALLEAYRYYQIRPSIGIYGGFDAQKAMMNHGIPLATWQTLYDPPRPSTLLWVLDDAWRSIVHVVSTRWSEYLSARANSGNKIKLEQYTEDGVIKYKLVKALNTVKKNYLPAMTYDELRSLLKEGVDQGMYQRNYTIGQILSNTATGKEAGNTALQLQGKKLAKGGAKWTPQDARQILSLIDAAEQPERVKQYADGSKLVTKAKKLTANTTTSQALPRRGLTGLFMDDGAFG